MSGQNQVPMLHVLAAQQAQGEAPNQAPATASDQAPGAPTPVCLPDIIDPLKNISDVPPFPMLPPPQNPVPIVRACFALSPADLAEIVKVTIAEYTKILGEAVRAGNYREAYYEVIGELQHMHVEVQGFVALAIFKKPDSNNLYGEGPQVHKRFEGNDELVAMLQNAYKAADAARAEKEEAEKRLQESVQAAEEKQNANETQ
uniref:Nudc_N domain-containing protein n=1 Tax=Caenorhabditis tropicalis TaxID=1561998 RepID=A0A1I7V3W2_9PELO